MEGSGATARFQIGAVSDSISVSDAINLAFPFRCSKNLPLEWLCGDPVQQISAHLRAHRFKNVQRQTVTTLLVCEHLRPNFKNHSLFFCCDTFCCNPAFCMDSFDNEPKKFSD